LLTSASDNDNNSTSLLETRLAASIIHDNPPLNYVLLFSFFLSNLSLSTSVENIYSVLRWILTISTSTSYDK